jgi:hypothetical protein
VEGAEIGSEEVELVLGELERSPVGHAGRMQDDERPSAFGQLGVGRAVEHGGIVELGRQVDAAEVGRDEAREVHRVRGAQRELTLDVACQEPVIEGLERIGAVQTVVRRRERPAGDPCDAVDLVQKGSSVLGASDLEVFQPHECAVREGCGSGTSARER